MSIALHVPFLTSYIISPFLWLEIVYRITTLKIFIPLQQHLTYIMYICIFKDINILMEGCLEKKIV